MDSEHSHRLAGCPLQAELGHSTRLTQGPLPMQKPTFASSYFIAVKRSFSECRDSSHPQCKRKASVGSLIRPMVTFSRLRRWRTRALKIKSRRRRTRNTSDPVHLRASPLGLLLFHQGSEPAQVPLLVEPPLAMTASPTSWFASQSTGQGASLK